MGVIASMLQDGDGSGFVEPQDLEARTAAAASDQNESGNGEAEDETDKPSFNALTAAEMNVMYSLFFYLFPGQRALITVLLNSTGRKVRVSSYSSSTS
jgi:hypothetical protein